MRLSKKSKQQYLYLKISEMIEDQINNELLKIGDKLPSVRIMRKNHGVSVSTILKAYYHLESKGLIEARPQSGYYVRFTPKQFPAQPTKSSTDYKPGGDTAEEIIDEVYQNISDRDRIVFSLGIPSLQLIPVSKLNKAITEATRKLPFGGIGYENVQGNIHLRKQIAKWSLTWEGRLTPDEIVTTTGCMDALSLSLAATTVKGDTIAVESPCFFSILQLAESMGLKVIELPTEPKSGIDIDALRKTVAGKKIKVIILMSNFSNPLGCCIPDNNKKEIVELIQNNNIPLIEDDIYGDIFFNTSRPKTCKSFDNSGLVLLCSSFSKTLAPGYRVGWVAPGKYIEKIRRLKLYREVSSTTIQQEAVALFLENGRYENHLRRLRNILHVNSMQYMRTISGFFPKDTRISHPQGGLFLWVECNKRVDTYQLFKIAIKDGTSIAPGRMFTLKNQFHNCMRLCFGLPWNEKIEESLIRLGEIIFQLNK
jgi:DNA-binding transcriptional MocR family regulator